MGTGVLCLIMLCKLVKWSVFVSFCFSWMWSVAEVHDKMELVKHIKPLVGEADWPVWKRKIRDLLGLPRRSCICNWWQVSKTWHTEFCSRESIRKRELVSIQTGCRIADVLNVGLKTWLSLCIWFSIQITWKSNSRWHWQIKTSVQIYRRYHQCQFIVTPWWRKRYSHLLLGCRFWWVYSDWQINIRSFTNLCRSSCLFAKSMPRLCYWLHYRSKGSFSQRSLKRNNLA